jgi:hypothetical protein
MAQEIVGFKIEINGQERVVQSLGEMKQLIKDANFELLAAQQNFGEYSQEAVNAAKKVATLKDTLQEAGETAQLFDPGRKFQAFAGALNATAGGITAFQGALGLIGVESENVEKSLLKVQSALALSQGLSTITDSVKDFQRLAAVIQSVTLFQKAYQLATIAATAIQRAFGVAVAGTGVAFRALRGAILATGIGALTIGIGVLVSKIMDWANSASEAEKAQNKLAESTKTMNQDIGKEREIYNLRLRQNENELNVLRNKLKTTGKLNEEELAQFKKLKTDKEVLDIQESNRINKDAEDETKKRQEENSKVVEDRKARNKEIQDADKQLREQAIKISDEIFLSEIEDEREKEEVKLALEFERAKKDIENSVGTQAAKNEALLLLQTQYDLQRKEIQQQRAAEEVDILTNKLFAEVQAEQEASDAKIKASQDELDAITNNLLAEVEAEEKASKAKVQIAEYESQFKKQQLDEVGNALQNLSAIAGKETAAGKALGIATALINTYQGASEALKQKSTLPSPFDVIAKVANVAAIVATGIKTVRAITAVEVPGGGGAGVKSPTVSSLSGSAPIIPSAPLVNTRTQLDSTSIQQLGSATNRSYVLESDVTNSQERIRRINRAARLS